MPLLAFQELFQKRKLMPDLMLCAQRLFCRIVVIKRPAQRSHLSNAKDGSVEFRARHLFVAFFR
jgi:hypothetical protein